MSSVTWKPDEIGFLTPYITVSDPVKSLAFYEAAFGFQPARTLPDESGNIGHAEMTYQDEVIIMFAPEGAWGNDTKTPANSKVSPPSAFYVYAEDVDALVEQARKSGATIVTEPEDMFWGDRVAKMLDSDGHIWTFATKVGEFQAP